MSYAKLRGKIKEVYGTQAAFAAALGISNTSLTFRLNGRMQWKTDEMNAACELLGIPLTEMHEYFFVKLV